MNVNVNEAGRNCQSAGIDDLRTIGHQGTGIGDGQNAVSGDQDVGTRGDEAGFTVKGLGDSTEAIGLVFSAIDAAAMQVAPLAEVGILAESFRNMATHWVMSAVKPETRERRFATLLAEGRAGRRPRPFRIGPD